MRGITAMAAGSSAQKQRTDRCGGGRRPCDGLSGIAEHAHAPMNIWPNPATDRVTIEDLVSGTPVEFFTLTGQRVAVRIAQQNAAIDVSGLAPGTYVLRARADGSVRNARFIKW